MDPLLSLFNIGHKIYLQKYGNSLCNGVILYRSGIYSRRAWNAVIKARLSVENKCFSPKFGNR